MFVCAKKLKNDESLFGKRALCSEMSRAHFTYSPQINLCDLNFLLYLPFVIGEDKSQGQKGSNCQLFLAVCKWFRIRLSFLCSEPQKKGWHIWLWLTWSKVSPMQNTDCTSVDYQKNRSPALLSLSLIFFPSIK